MSQAWIAYWWSGPVFTLEFLADRLAQKLGEIRFAEFLERFGDNLLELDEHERRSQ